ncbi:MAG: transcriptional repressor [Clostridia bacterium]|jgi:Fur family peroxide stress response transcriptional regulator|nr:transcriptional repressor [Clostridia bacterium]
MKGINISEMLKENDIKPSYQRLKIYEYLINNRTHPTVDEIYKALVVEIPTLSKTTVYNTLNLFVEKNIVLLITIDENETRYDADTSVHGHFRCRKCKKIYDFEISVECMDLKDFEVYTKNVYFDGICNKCL